MEVEKHSIAVEQDLVGLWYPVDRRDCIVAPAVDTDLYPYVVVEVEEEDITESLSSNTPAAAVDKPDSESSQPSPL